MRITLGREILLALACAGLLSACSNSKTASPPPDRCSINGQITSQCQSPLTCIDGFCRQSCSDSSPCSDELTCSTQDYCVTGCKTKGDCAEYENCSTEGVCELTCVDKDGDGYGQYCALGDDCDDSETGAGIHPGATEIADDEVDNNCSGEVDEVNEWEQYPTCDDESRTGTKIAPNLMLVLDRSGSMDDEISSTDPTKKLAALKTAVASLLTINTPDVKIRFGLTAFPVPSRTDSCIPGAINVPIGDNTVATIGTIVNSLGSSNGTPTGTTLEYLNNEDNCPQLFDSTRENYIMLVTDGVPTCPDHDGDPYSADEMTAIEAATDYSAYPDFDRTLDAIIALENNNIRTFVIGVGEDLTNTSPNFLNRIATEGGMPQSGTTKYYPANSAAALKTVLEQIGQSVIGCTLTSDLDPDTDTNAQGQRLYSGRLWLVYNNGTQDVAIPRDTTHSNGFDYLGNKVFKVYGSYCDMMNAGTINNIRIIIGCRPPD